MSEKNCCCPEIPVEKPFKRPEGSDCPVDVKCTANPIVSAGTVTNGFATGSVEKEGMVPDLVEDTAANRSKVAEWKQPKLYVPHED